MKIKTSRRLHSVTIWLLSTIMVCLCGLIFNNVFNLSTNSWKIILRFTLYFVEVKKNKNLHCKICQDISRLASGVVAVSWSLWGTITTINCMSCLFNCWTVIKWKLNIFTPHTYPKKKVKRSRNVPRFWFYACQLFVLVKFGHLAEVLVVKL